MAEIGQWTNADGLTVKNPNYFKNPYNAVNRPDILKTFGGIKQLEIDIDLSKIASGATGYTTDIDNDGTLDGFNLGDVYLPAYSSVLRVTMVTQVAAAGGTSFTIGTYGLNGSAISANSLVTATEAVTANFNAIGKRVYGNGALVAATAGTASVGAADAFIGLAVTGTFTAGKIRAIIEYIDPLADA